MIKEYFDEIQNILETVYKTQQNNIKLAAETIADAAVANKNIFAFGSNHSSILIQELFYRTGGLAIINPILAPGLLLDVKPVTLTTAIERMDSYGKVIVDSVGFNAGDVLIVHSVSGRNTVPIEVAINARKLGVKVISLTNIDYSSHVLSRHSSGLRLFEVSDIVMDNCGCMGDAALKIPGLEEKVAPTSTVIGAAILNAMVAEVVNIFLERGITPPIFMSSNVEGGDLHNQNILQRYKDNIKYI